VKFVVHEGVPGGDGNDVGIPVYLEGGRCNEDNLRYFIIEIGAGKAELRGDLQVLSICD